MSGKFKGENTVNFEKIDFFNTYFRKVALKIHRKILKIGLVRADRVNRLGGKASSNFFRIVNTQWHA